MKTAFMFTGQGSEQMGMGLDLYNEYEVVKNIFDTANDKLGFKLTDICFGDEVKIKDTQYAQPSLLTLSTAIQTLFRNEGVVPDYTVGLSLGEYSAFVSSGSIDFLDGVMLVHKRGQFMKEDFVGLDCSMLAVLKTPIEIIEKCISEVSNGIVEIANYNTNAQTVISGESCAVNEVKEKLSELGYKSIPLNVNGAFHTSMLENASQKLNQELKKIDIKDIKIPVVTNVDASIVTDKNQIVDILTKQIKSSVMFLQCIETLINCGVDTFVEIGYGKTLASFVKKINKDVKVISVYDVKTYNDALNMIRGE